MAELNNQTKKLTKILEGEEIDIDFDPDQNADKNELINNLNNNMFCDECEDQPLTGKCLDCGDNFCQICFNFLHNKGNRKKHKFEILKKMKNEQFGTKFAKKQKTPLLIEKIDETNFCSDGIDKINLYDGISREIFLERAKYIPIRPKYEERKYIRLVEAMLEVSEYTDKIDIFSNISKKKRIHAQIKEICSILIGLVLAVNYEKGQKLIKEPNFKNNEKFFSYMFELARRHKIRNPDKMRTSYGKLIHFLQDSVRKEIQQLTDLNCVAEIKTVYSFLKERNSLDCLYDFPLLLKATNQIEIEDKNRNQIHFETKEKEANFNKFISKHANENISEEELKNAVYSIDDNHNFLSYNRIPVDKMLYYLKTYFDPNDDNNKLRSLAIYYGEKGSRLSHNHKKQYYFVLQTLNLWKEILNDFFKLWFKAEEDLLDSNRNYVLARTEQGLHRKQACNRVYREMVKILAKAQSRTKNWIGSSAIHLGDDNVPNAFTFIDKYTQISRIINPIIITLRRIPELKKSNIWAYVEAEFGTEENLKLSILSDFFKFAFDGSGADNFFSAGSCIDGRLTSAWNWCSKISTKKFYPIFLFMGFSSFDGNWS